MDPTFINNDHPKNGHPLVSNDCDKKFPKDRREAMKFVDSYKAWVTCRIQGMVENMEEIVREKRKWISNEIVDKETIFGS